MAVSVYPSDVLIAAALAVSVYDSADAKVVDAEFEIAVLRLVTSLAIAVSVYPS